MASQVERLSLRLRLDIRIVERRAKMNREGAAEED